MADTLIFLILFVGFVANIRDVFRLGLDLNGPRDVGEVVKAEVGERVVDVGRPRVALADLADEGRQNIWKMKIRKC